MNEINFSNIDTSVDDRGYLRFCNTFDLTKYVRFYDVINYLFQGTDNIKYKYILYIARLKDDINIIQKYNFNNKS
mgnify:CR=1 FL=1